MHRKHLEIYVNMTRDDIVKCVTQNIIEIFIWPDILIN